MSEHTPFEGEMREAWVATYSRDGWLTNEAIVRGQREFNRWLDSVKAEAWDEGFEEHEINTEQARAGNPYREETT